MKKIGVKTLLRLGCCCGLLFCMSGSEGMNVNSPKPSQSDVKKSEVAGDPFEVIQGENVDTTRSVLDSRADVGVSNSSDIYSIHLEADAGNLERLEVLLQQPNVNINQYNRNGLTPLTHVICKLRSFFKLSDEVVTKRINTIRFLLKKGANPDGIDPEFKKGFRELPLKTALMIDPRIIEPDTIPLVAAAVADNAEVVKILLDAGADVNLRTSNGEPALFIAAGHGNLKIVKILLNHPRINVDEVTHLGQTSLDAAVNAFDNAQRSNNTTKANDLITIIKLLLKKGADPNTPDMAGITPLYRIIAVGDIDLIDIFIKHTSRHRGEPVIFALLEDKCKNRVKKLNVLIKELGKGILNNTNHRGKNILGEIEKLKEEYPESVTYIAELEELEQYIKQLIDQNS